MSQRRAQLSLIATTIVLVSVALGSSVAVARRLLERHASLEPPASLAQVAATGKPIAEEALSFRARLDAFAVESRGARRPAAHPRTLASWRALRAFPAAPPRIPHGLTNQEWLDASCKTCHERGGYSQRFGAYAPIAPHPGQRACTQCHLADADVTGIAAPNIDSAPDARCRQCHSATTLASAPMRTTLSPLPVSAWPALVRVRPDGPPPAIPHSLRQRGSCASCHAGPGAVAEIRTSHPERSYCRQCHLAGGVS